MHTRPHLKATLRSATAALIELGLALSSAAAARPDARCVQANPAVIGRCYFLRGTASPSADIGMVVGAPTQRAIVLWSPPGTEVCAPPQVEAALDTMHASVKGGFVVCPLPEQPSQFARGFMHYGCISQATELQVIYDLRSE